MGNSDLASILGPLDIWQFVILHRESKQITQDLNLYRVPNDLETLMKILVALMKNL